MNLTAVSSALLGWLWRATWEASVMTILVLIVQTLFKKRLTAGWRYALWGLVIVRLTLPTTIPAPWSAFNLLAVQARPANEAPSRNLVSPAPAVSAPSSVLAPASVPEPISLVDLKGRGDSAPTPGWNFRIFRLLLWVWLAGVSVGSLRLLLANCWLSKLVKQGTRIREQQVLGLLANCAQLMRVRKVPLLVATSQFDSPAVFGCFRPKLLLPARLAGAFSPAELRHVFLHELAHIRRGDSAMNWLMACLEALHWFNPILRYGFRRMHADRELACDALVLSRMEPGESQSYGRTILKLLESLTRPAVVPGLVGILEEKQQMRRRMQMITQNTHTPGQPLLAVLILASLGIFTLTDAQTAAPGNTAPASPPAEEETVKAGATAPSAELLAQEREIDRRHLQRIYKAIQAYYKEHRDLPNWLSDLVPQYLPDAGDLISPVETRTGKSVLFGREDPKIHTSYIYEFNAAPAPEEFNQGRSVPLTCKAWKLMQLQKFGMVTPILRSHIDQPVLNVAYSGQIYETGLLWEDDPNTAALVKQNPLLGPRQGGIPGSRLTVHVVDADTGAPIPEAKVRNGIGSEFGLLPPGEGTTDTSGNLSVALGEWKVNFLFLNASHPGYSPLGTEWNRERDQQDSPPAELTLKLTRKSP